MKIPDLHRQISIPEKMSLIVLHKDKVASRNNSEDLLRFAVCSEPFAGIAFTCLASDSHKRTGSEVVAIPHDWRDQSTKTGSNLMYYKDNIPVPSYAMNCDDADGWFVVSNGRFVTQIDHKWLLEVVAQMQADIVAVNVVPRLQVAHEKALITPQSKLVGFRRLYDNSVRTTPVPDRWPHYLFIKTDILNNLLVDNALPLAFDEFINNCSLKSLRVHSLDIGGSVMDLATEEGSLSLLAYRLNNFEKNHHNRQNHENKISDVKKSKISRNIKLFGKILFAKEVSIDDNVIILGPAVICQGAGIGKGAVIRNSIIGPGVSVAGNQIVENRILVSQQYCLKNNRQNTNSRTFYRTSSSNNFRVWPVFSYPGCVKRIIDIIVAILALVLFAPIIPIIVVTIKLTSRGAIFFKDLRQGLHGKEFNCIKFRTMLVGADKIQEKLRVLNQADGPQFKITDDPRINSVGKFLRDTYLDEISQFFNVLIGQMSIVGPRPSPESENILCPRWRDARLSVRPGITGLWQVLRTREPMKDFQEWIYYDIRYVNKLSLKLDLWICWQTAVKLTKNFIDQF